MYKKSLSVINGAYENIKYATLSLLTALRWGGNVVPSWFSLIFSNLIMASFWIGLASLITDVAKSTAEIISAKNINLPRVAGLIYSVTKVLAAGVFLIPLANPGTAFLIGFGTLFISSIIYNLGRAALNFSRSQHAPSSEANQYTIQGIRALMDIGLSLAFFTSVLTGLQLILGSPTGVLPLATFEVIYFSVAGFFLSLQILPDAWLQTIFMLPRSVPQQTNNVDEQIALVHSNTASAAQNTTHFGLMFKQAYRSEVVKQILQQSNNTDAAKVYLINEIQQKLRSLPSKPSEGKIEQKINALNNALNMLNNGSIQTDVLDSIIDKNILLEQSFFRDVSDTKDILDAVKNYFESKNHLAATEEKTLAVVY